MVNINKGEQEGFDYCYIHFIDQNEPIAKSEVQILLKSSFPLPISL